jgi:hypothetical protein
MTFLPGCPCPARQSRDATGCERFLWMGVTPAGSRQHQGDEAPRPRRRAIFSGWRPSSLDGPDANGVETFAQALSQGLLHTHLPPTRRGTTTLEARAGAREPARVVNLVVFERLPERPGTTVARREVTAGAPAQIAEAAPQPLLVLRRHDRAPMVRHQAISPDFSAGLCGPRCRAGPDQADQRIRRTTSSRDDGRVAQRCGDLSSRPRGRRNTALANAARRGWLNHSAASPA